MANAALDGFTVTAGEAGVSGGGLHVAGAVLDVRNCAFIVNRAHGEDAHTGARKSSDAAPGWRLS